MQNTNTAPPHRKIVKPIMVCQCQPLKSLLYVTLVFPGVISMSLPANSAINTESLSLGAETLRGQVLEASRKDAGLAGMDLKGIAWIEHINLVVGSASKAECFYQDFLGFTRDPNARFHVNLGQQQFHLAENGDDAQVIAGSVGLVVPSLHTLRSRLEKAETDLQGTMFGVLQDSHDFLSVSCPWGNTFHIYDLESEKGRTSESDSPQKMVAMHAEGGPYASRMAVRGQPGIRFLEIACPPESAKKIAKFYEEVIGCTVIQCDEKSAIVSAGPGVHIIFQEQASLSEQQSARMKGVHVCIYAANFKGLYDDLKSRELIWTNPRFTRLDSCDTWEEAQSSRTLRFRHLVDVDSEQAVLLELEHETRPLRHGQYMKVPMYEAK